ncbi:hypothetical protein K7X08_036356 [Anisodus acutangulus]|uniref:Uncharacterized protein n=1 Tax=Anisodus acutangulus TaxID=402998 RepID=A0A9Q1L8H7_9SOLA|nr:hypothetical protein K7X08_036356 [Anisodus acutangulus]
MGDHLTYKDKNTKVDDLHGPSNVMVEGMKEGDRVVDDAMDECVKIGDDVSKISGDEIDWFAVLNVEFFKFTQSDSVKNDMTMEKVDNVVKSVTRTVLNDQVVNDVADECVKVCDDVDWSIVHDIKFSKFIQPDNVKNDKAMKEIGNVVKGGTEAMKEIGNVVKGGTEAMKEVGTEKLQELGVGKNTGDELEDHVADEEKNAMKEVDWYVVSDIEFSKFTQSCSDKRAIAGAKKNVVVTKDYGIFAVVFAEYLIEGRKISKVVNDIDAIHSRYGALLWDYGKKKQRKDVISDDESTGRLKRE